jgi:hypothetical protein
MIEKKEVTGTRSFEYIRKQLSRGKTLSSFINTLLPIEKANVYSFVPSETSIENLFQFDSGRLYPFNRESLKSANPIIPIRNDSRPLIIEEIQKHINNNSNNCCLFEEPVGVPSDPWVITSGMEYIHLNNIEMFYFFDNNNNDVKKIEKAFIASEDYIFLCALSSLDPTELNDVTSHKEVLLEFLQLFATKITTFFVKAYDGEGYLMWHKIYR